MRKLIALTTMVLLSGLVSPQPASATSAGTPLRTGTILVPARPSNGLGPMPGCRGVPDCLAWQQVCTRPVPRNNGVTASIVDVRPLAGAATERRFRILRRLGVSLYDGVAIEFWNSHCASVSSPDDLSDVVWARFTIPEGATWMTVTSPCHWVCMSFGGVALKWGLW